MVPLALPTPHPLVPPPASRNLGHVPRVAISVLMFVLLAARNRGRVVSGLSVEAAVELVQDKINGYMESGPDGLRRAFKAFDTDGGGTIDSEEFAAALKKRFGLVFEEALHAQLMGYHFRVIIIMIGTLG
eukprot:SAG25_NODE_491_length_7415_cov_6.908557_6_plen_130_part_00